MTDKKTLRTEIARYKRNIDPAALRELSAPILRKLAAHPRFLDARTVLLYHSLPDEVFTHDFIAYWSTRKNILLPVVTGDELELRMYTPQEGLAEGRYGILEPSGTTCYTDYEAIDLAVIPGVAFDKEGGRLGRGKGYYDRLLGRIRAHRDIYKIGICFDFQMVDKVPATAHDIRMDEVITFVPILPRTNGTQSAG